MLPFSSNLSSLFKILTVLVQMPSEMHSETEFWTEPLSSSSVLIIKANCDLDSFYRRGNISTGPDPCGMAEWRTRSVSDGHYSSLFSLRVLSGSCNVGWWEAEVDTFSSVKISCSISFYPFFFLTGSLPLSATRGAPKKKKKKEEKMPSCQRTQLTIPITIWG